MASPWTEQEDATLRREVPLRSFAEVARMVGRSLRATEARAHLIGVKRAIWSSWTDAEIATLREIYPVMSNADVADRLGRSETAIKVKVRELQLRKTGEYMSALRKAGATPKAPGIRSMKPRAPVVRSAAAQQRAGRFEREGGTYSPTADAVRFLQRIGPIGRCDADGVFAQSGAFWKFCGRVMDADAVEARAKRSGWTVPPVMARGKAA